MPTPLAQPVAAPFSPRTVRVLQAYGVPRSKSERGGSGPIREITDVFSPFVSFHFT